MNNLRYLYYGLYFLFAFDFGIWIALEFDSHAGTVPLLVNCYPIMIIGGTLLFFLFMKIITGLSFKNLVAKMLACLIGMVLTTCLVFIAVKFFLSGFHKSNLAFVVFLFGITPLPIFSLIMLCSNDFFDFVSSTSLSTLLFPYERGSGFYKTQSAISAVLIVAGLILGVIVQSLGF